MRDTLTMAVPRRSAVLFALAVGIFATGAIVGAKMDDRVKQLFVAEQPSQRFLDRLELLERFPPSGEVALIGDSHIERGPWDELLTPEAANFGMGGAHVEHILRRIGSLEQEIAIVWGGVNNLIIGDEPSAVAADLCKLSKEFGGRLFVLTIAPVSGRYRRYNEMIIEANKHMRAGDCLSRENIIDIYPLLTDGRELSARFTNDGLHLNADGYSVVSEMLEESLKLVD